MKNGHLNSSIEVTVNSISQDFLDLIPQDIIKIFPQDWRTRTKSIKDPANDTEYYLIGEGTEEFPFFIFGTGVSYDNKSKKVVSYFHRMPKDNTDKMRSEIELVYLLAGNIGLEVIYYYDQQNQPQVISTPTLSFRDLIVKDSLYYANSVGNLTLQSPLELQSEDINLLSPFSANLVTQIQDELERYALSCQKPVFWKRPDFQGIFISIPVKNQVVTFFQDSQPYEGLNDKKIRLRYLDLTRSNTQIDESQVDKLMQTALMSYVSLVREYQREEGVEPDFLIEEGFAYSDLGRSGVEYSAYLNPVEA